MVTTREKLEANGDPKSDVAERKDMVTGSQHVSAQELFADARSIIEELHVNIKSYEALDEGSSKRGGDGLFSAGLVSILRLKKSHRMLCELVETLREQTAGVKSELDVSSLHLQNLLYQKNHYQREIQACRSYTSAYSDEELELVSEEEFQQIRAAASAAAVAEQEPKDNIINEPRDVTKKLEDTSDAEEGALEAMDVEEGREPQEPDEEDQMEYGEEEKEQEKEYEEDDAHIMMLARLRHEVHRRKVCLEELAALKSERDSVAADLAKQRNILSAIETEVARLKHSVKNSLISFEGNSDGQRSFNVYAEEFVMPQ